MSGYVPRHRRNPRRSYDREGREIPPPMVAHELRRGVSTIGVHCNQCQHHVVLGIEGLPDDLPIVDIPLRLRLRCGQCGSKNAGIMVDTVALYASDRATRGVPEASVPTDYRVIPWRELIEAKRAAEIAAAAEPETPGIDL